MVFTFGSSSLTDNEVLEIVHKNFDLRPGMIIRSLNLKRPIYERTAENGHFGNDTFPWEQPKSLEMEEYTRNKLTAPALANGNSLVSL